MCLREHMVVVRILNFCRCFFFLVILISVYQGGSPVILPTGQKDYLPHVHCLRSDSANFFASTSWPCT